MLDFFSWLEADAEARKISVETEQRDRFERALGSQKHCDRAMPGSSSVSKTANHPHGKLQAKPLVGNFDLHGMRLYDTVSSIIEASKAAKLRITDVSRVGYVSCLKDKIVGDAQGANGPELCISQVDFVSKEIRVTVNFVEDLPAHPGCMAAYSIDSVRPDPEGGTGTFDAYKEALKRKYGTPDFGLDVGGSARWTTESAQLHYEHNPYLGYTLLLDDISFHDIAKAAFDQLRDATRPIKQPEL
jgi:hypothetical protein